jgi:hypothetical protein
MFAELVQAHFCVQRFISLRSFDLMEAALRTNFTADFARRDGLLDMSASADRTSVYFRSVAFLSAARRIVML